MNVEQHVEQRKEMRAQIKALISELLDPLERTIIEDIRAKNSIPADKVSQFGYRAMELAEILDQFSDEAENRVSKLKEVLLYLEDRSEASWDIDHTAQSFDDMEQALTQSRQKALNSLDLRRGNIVPPCWL